MVVSMVGNFIAAKSKIQELALDDSESRLIAEAAGNVAKLYEIPVNEKTAAWIGLATCLGTIYGAKVVAMKMNRELRKGSPS